MREFHKIFPNVDTVLVCFTAAVDFVRGKIGITFSDEYAVRAKI